MLEQSLVLELMEPSFSNEASLSRSFESQSVVSGERVKFLLCPTCSPTSVSPRSSDSALGEPPPSVTNPLSPLGGDRSNRHMLLPAPSPPPPPPPSTTGRSPEEDRATPATEAAT